MTQAQARARAAANSGLMNESPDSPWLVACLCAAWCRSCDEYRGTFDALAQQFGREARFLWVDIEDDEAALDGVDVVDFPTLLLSRDDAVYFFGPVLPHPQTARQLIQRALQGDFAALRDETLAGLPSRLRALPRPRVGQT